MQDELLEQGIPPAAIIKGYEMAAGEGNGDAYRQHARQHSI